MLPFETVIYKHVLGYDSIFKVKHNLAMFINILHTQTHYIHYSIPLIKNQNYQFPNLSLQKSKIVIYINRPIIKERIQ